MDNSILTLNDLLFNSLTTHKNKVALNFANQKFTYNQLYISSNKIANTLIDIGVKNNTRVGLFISNRIEYVISEIAIYFSGGAKVALNSMLGQEEVKYILKDSNSEVVIIEYQFFNLILDILDELPMLKTIIVLNAPVDNYLSIGQSDKQLIKWEEIILNGSDKALNIKIYPSDISFILYTGGTTGNPKGVVHTRKTTSLTYLSIILEADIRSKEKILLTTPLPHAAGLYLFAGLLKGAEIFLEEGFNPKDILELIEREKITFLSMVPTTIYRLIDSMEHNDYDISSIFTIQYGTAPIAPSRLKQAINIFGEVFIQAYGSTETQSVVAWLKKEDHVIGFESEKKLLSCGKASMFSQIKIVDQQGEEVIRKEGEIVVKCLTNMVEYLNLPHMTKEVISNGWFYTGDIGYMDENGYIYLLDRKKDMIISGGMNVYSTEVENVLQKHPDIERAAVIGIPDSEWGEAVTAFVVGKDTMNEKELIQYCKGNLSKYKVPKNILFVKQLPLTHYGKIDKKSLRIPYWEVMERKI